MNDQLTKAMKIRRETHDRLLPELIVKLIEKGFSEEMIDDRVETAIKLIDQYLWMNHDTYIKSLGNLAEPKS